MLQSHCMDHVAPSPHHLQVLHMAGKLLIIGLKAPSEGSVVADNMNLSTCAALISRNTVLLLAVTGCCAPSVRAGEHKRKSGSS